jgi:hypothetical protein
VASILPPLNAVRLVQNAEFPFIFDVELRGLASLRQWSSVEAHLILYPYSRQVRSSNFTLFPYEEYTNDILTRRRSLYIPIPSPANSLFGLFLGFVIALVFLLLDPAQVLSVQSVIAILGAYFIGKDLWNDIEAGLSAVTSAWRLRYQANPYQYRIEKNTTLTGYSALAREHRYGTASLLAEKIDFIPNSNSKTVRMFFDRDTLAALGEENAHMLSIRIEPDLVDEFLEAGFMFGVKLSLNEGGPWLRRSHEFFQSVSRGRRGCLDERGAWIDDATMKREVTLVRSLRYLHGRRVLRDTHIVAD